MPPRGVPTSVLLHGRERKGSGRPLTNLCKRVANNRRRRVGEERSDRRLQTSIHCSSSHEEEGSHNTSSSKQATKRLSSGGGRVPPPEESHLSNLPTLYGGVLVDFLPGSQEDGRLETHTEFETVEQIHKTKKVQNGMPSNGSESSHLRLLGNLDRPEGCLSSCANPPRPSEMAKIFYQGPGLCFQVPSFWPIYSPRVFTRVVRAVGAFLRRQGVQIHRYLDDWLITSRTLDMAHRHTKFVLETVSRLGFIVNAKKSQIQPPQTPLFLGVRIDLIQGRAYSSQERVINLVSCIKIFNQAETAPAAAWLKILGLMGSMVDLVPYCRLRMRPIQLHLRFHYRPSVHILSRSVPLSDIIHRELIWWEEESNLLVGVICGVWPQDQTTLHINILELLAVFNSLKDLESRLELQNKRILIQSDNSTVVSYIRKQGGHGRHPYAFIPGNSYGGVFRGGYRCQPFTFQGRRIPWQTICHGGCR